MPEPLCLAEVRLWDRTVGAVAELDDGQIVFEYDETFRREGPEISPPHMPLGTRGPQRLDGWALPYAFLRFRRHLRCRRSSRAVGLSTPSRKPSSGPE